MKKIIWFIILLSLFAFCRTNTQKKQPVTEVVTHNDSATPANAYNDLFMDSIKVADYLKENNISAAMGREVADFYKARNYEFAWFWSEGLSEQGMGFASLLNLSGDTASNVLRLQKTLNHFLGVGNLKVSADKRIVNDEILLTMSFISYMDQHYGKAVMSEEELGHFVPQIRSEPMMTAQSELRRWFGSGNNYLHTNNTCNLLIPYLAKYYTLAEGNQWKTIDITGRYVYGKSYPDIPNIKKDLFLSGDMDTQTDTSSFFDDMLVMGIRHFQQRIGQKPDGQINLQLLKLLSISPKDMVKKILVNMNRMRWLPQHLPVELLKVNIPEFELYVKDSGKLIHQMEVIVGKEGHNTVLFSDVMKTIVFSPYWNVPPGIVRNEILPAMARDAGYLRKNNMEITGEEGGLPVIRQRPGPDNSLGRVKFLFPNSFAIYLHDTPEKWLFNHNSRAFSHGCIRLQDALWLAEWLLRKDKNWNHQRILAAMDRGRPEFVQLKTPVDVIITYYTCWADSNGFHIRDDIYGHDRSVMKKMFK